MGTVVSAERVSGSEKLIKLQFDLGEKDETGGIVPRQVLSGIGKAYDPEALLGIQLVLITNLDPKMLMGEESRGMVLAAHGAEEEPILLVPQKAVPPGSLVS